jgi:DNA-binding NarL/FixJ family response regulator
MRDLEVIGQAGLGQVAVSQIAELQPDVVPLDIRLPDVSGIYVCRTLRSWAQPPQVVLVALADSKSYVEIARNVGALGFVNKADFAAELPVVLALCTAMPAAGA